MIKLLTRTFSQTNFKIYLNFLKMSTRRTSTGQKKLELYKKIRERENSHLKGKELNEEQREKHYKSYRCDGCNSLLQSEDKHKYGYIGTQVFKKSIEENIKLIESSYGAKAESSDSKTMEFLQAVQRQLGVKIFNNSTKRFDNLDNVEVLLRLQEKIDEYEQTEQTIRRSKKQRQEIYCYRCFTLKYHNKLPEEYNVEEPIADNNQELIMDKVFRKHKDLPVLYLLVVDILDIAGSFQKYVFDRLFERKSQMAIVVNKLDIANEKYLNKHLLLESIRQLMAEFTRDRESLQKGEVEERISNIKIFLTSNVSKAGIQRLEQYLEDTAIKRIQLVGFPNTGKTTLLNQLAQLSRPTSKVPGTTIFITESQYKKQLIYDMPGMHSPSNMYSLISTPNLKSLLAWNKFYSPPIMLSQALFFGGRVEVRDAKIILFGLGGACSSDNRWFLLNYKEFWKGLPAPHLLKIKKYQFNLTFIDGKANDLQIAGWGFIAFRLAVSKQGESTKKMTLYLPESIRFRFRQSVLTDSQIFRYKSNVVKRFRLERIHESKAEGRKRSDLV